MPQHHDAYLRGHQASDMDTAPDAAALLSAIPGSDDAPWLRLTGVELAALYKRFKKKLPSSAHHAGNSISHGDFWRPSEALLLRELAARGRGPAHYRLARARAAAAAATNAAATATIAGGGSTTGAQPPFMDTANIETKLSLRREEATATAGRRKSLALGEVSVDVLLRDATEEQRALERGNRGMRLNVLKQRKRQAADELQGRRSSKLPVLDDDAMTMDATPTTSKAGHASLPMRHGRRRGVRHGSRATKPARPTRRASRPAMITASTGTFVTPAATRTTAAVTATESVRRVTEFPSFMFEVGRTTASSPASPPVAGNVPGRPHSTHVAVGLPHVNGTTSSAETVMASDEQDDTGRHLQHSTAPHVPCVFAGVGVFRSAVVNPPSLGIASAATADDNKSPTEHSRRRSSRTRRFSARAVIHH